MRQVHQWRMRWGFVLLPLALVLALAGCGVTSGTGGPTGAGSPTSGTAVSCDTKPAVPSTAASTSANGEPSASGTVPTVPPAPNVTVAAGRLTITTDQRHYAPCVVIHATIANGFEAIIYVTDHHTSCGLLTLERQVNGAWQAQGRCPLMTPTRLLEIPTNTAVAQSIAPGESGLRATNWPAGTYRLTLTYATGSSDHQVPQVPIASAPFTIG
jgi:hypothetical protein